MRRDIDAALQELRTAVEEARSMPMSASVMVNRAELLDLIQTLTRTVDATLSEATEVVGDREAVVAEGQTEADEILRVAQLERDKLVSDTDVYRLASERAEEIAEDARREAGALRAETDEYVEARLANFELTLERTLDVVRRGRARLSGGHSHGLADDSDVAGMTLPDHLER